MIDFVNYFKMAVDFLTLYAVRWAWLRFVTLFIARWKAILAIQVWSGSWMCWSTIPITVACRTWRYSTRIA